MYLACNLAYPACKSMYPGGVSLPATGNSCAAVDCGRQGRCASSMPTPPPALCTSSVPALCSLRVAHAPICGPPQHHSLATPPAPCSCLNGRCVCSAVQGKEVAVGPRCSVAGPVPPTAPRRAAVVVSPSGVDTDGCGSTRWPCASVRHALLLQFWEWAPQLAESALTRQQPTRLGSSPSALQKPTRLLRAPLWA